MTTYTTCNHCLSVHVDTDQTAKAAVDEGHVRWFVTECENCGNSARSVRARAWTPITPEGFQELDSLEIQARRERVEQLTGERPWE